MSYRRLIGTFDSLDEKIERQFLEITEHLSKLKNNEEQFQGEIKKIVRRLEQLELKIQRLETNQHNTVITQTNNEDSRELQVMNGVPPLDGWNNMNTLFKGLNVDLEKLSYALLIFSNMYGQNSIKVFNYEIEVEKVAQVLLFLSQLNNESTEGIKELLEDGKQ